MLVATSYGIVKKYQISSNIISVDELSDLSAPTKYFFMTCPPVRHLRRNVKVNQSPILKYDHVTSLENSDVQTGKLQALTQYTEYSGYSLTIVFST